MLRLTRSIGFSSAHRYWREEWTAERNREVFGPNVDLHGHNYRVEVSVVGDYDPETGMAADLGLLDRLLESEVAKPLGWCDLSQDVEALAGRIPTTETLAVHVWRQLSAALAESQPQPPMRLERVRVYESPELFVDYEGSGADTAAAAGPRSGKPR